MKDFIGAVNAGYTNEEINQANGTTGKDYIGAVKAGYTNEDLNSAIEITNTDTNTPPVETNKDSIDIIKKSNDAQNNALDVTYEQKIKSLDDMGLDEEQYKVVKANLDAKYAVKKEEIHNSFWDKAKKAIETFGNAQTEYGMAGQITPEAIGQNEQVARGFARLPLGLGKISENIYNLLPGKDANIISNAIKDNELAIKQYAKDKGISEDQISPADVGQFFAESLPLSRSASIFKNSVLFGTNVGLSEYGSGKAAKDAAFIGAESAAKAYATTKVASIILSPLIARITGISADAKLAGKKIGLSDDEIIEATKGVPLKDQSLKLAQQYPELIGNYKQALADGDSLKIKLSNDIQERTNAIDKASQKNDFPEIEKLADQSWTIMEKEVAKSNIKIDASDLTKNIETVKAFAGVDEKAKSEILALENRLQSDPNVSLDYLLKIRKQINNRMSSTRGTPAFDYYKDLQTNLDKMVDANVPTAYTDLISSTRKIYENKMNQKDLLDILKNSKTKPEVSGVSNQAVDYNKALELINEKGLKGTVVEQTVNTLKDLESKFATDYAIMGNTKTKGENPRTGALGLLSEVKSVLMKYFWRIGESGENIQIQNAIEKSIKNGSNPIEYLDNIIKSKDIPTDIKKEIIDNVSKTRNIRREDANKIKFMEVQVDKEMSNLGLDSSYGGKATKESKAKPSYNDISDSLFGTKKVDKSGNLGMTSSYNK